MDNPPQVPPPFVWEHIGSLIGALATLVAGIAGGLKLAERRMRSRGRGESNDTLTSTLENKIHKLRSELSKPIAENYMEIQLLKGRLDRLEQEAKRDREEFSGKVSSIHLHIESRFASAEKELRDLTKAVYISMGRSGQDE